MSKMAGPVLSPVRRFSLSALSDKENSPLGVSRLRTLLKRKAKKAENTTESVTAKKGKIVKRNAWVNLKDGTTIKLCSSCAIKNSNLTSDTQNTKDKPKITKKTKENIDDTKNKRTLRGVKTKTIESEKKSTSSIKEKSITDRKEIVKITKPKETKKSKNDTEIKTPMSNKENREKIAIVDQNSMKPAKIKRAPKKTLNVDNDTLKGNKKNTSHVTTEEKATMGTKTKIRKVVKSTNNNNKIIVKVPNQRKTDKNKSQNNKKSVFDQMNISDLVDSNNENKERKRNKNKTDVEIEPNKSENNKRATKVKPKILNEKITGKINHTKPMNTNVKIPKLTKASTNKKNNNKIETSSKSFNNSDTSENSDNSTRAKLGKTKAIKKGASVVAKKVKSKDPIKKSTEIQTKKKKTPSRITTTNKKIKSDKLNRPQNTVIENINDNSIDNLLSPNLGMHSTFIDDLYQKKRINENQNLEPTDNVCVKMEPIDDYFNTNNNEDAFLNLKNQVLQNDPEIIKSKSQKKLTKPEKLLHVTFRNTSKERKPTSSKQVKDKNYKKDKEARKKFKNDKKVAIAMAQMSKHFSKLQIGSVGELRIGSRISDISPIVSSSEDSSLHSCHCESYSSSSSSSHCNCWECKMRRTSSSSSWTGSSEYADDTSFSSNSSESSVFEDSDRKSVYKKNIYKNYELRNRDK